MFPVLSFDSDRGPRAVLRKAVGGLSHTSVGQIARVSDRKGVTHVSHTLLLTKGDIHHFPQSGPALPRLRRFTVFPFGIGG